MSDHETTFAYNAGDLGDHPLNFKVPDDDQDLNAHDSVTQLGAYRDSEASSPTVSEASVFQNIKLLS